MHGNDDGDWGNKKDAALKEPLTNACIIMEINHAKEENGTPKTLQRSNIV